MPGHDIVRIYEAVESLLVLHNILHDYGDNPADIDDFVRGDPLTAAAAAAANHDDDDNDADLRARQEEIFELRRQVQGQGTRATRFAEGQLRRQRLVDHMFPR